MQITKEGIEINREELSALLAFAGNERIPNVRFDVRRSGAKLRAHATDGHRMIVGTSHEAAPEGVQGEWMIPADHLVACKRAVASDEVCVLVIRRGNIGRAILRNAETGQISSTIVFPENASTQMTFPNVEIIPMVKNLNGSWFAVQGTFLRDFGLVSKAVGKHPITLYPPIDPAIDAIGFESRGETVTWEGVVMPVKVAGPGDDLDDDLDDDSDHEGFAMTEESGLDEDPDTSILDAKADEPRDTEIPPPDLKTEKKPRASRKNKAGGK